MGRLTSARASATRCCWPPESWFGLRLISAASRTRSSSAATRSVDLVLGDLLAAKAEGDVVTDAQVGEQRIALKHRVRRALVGREADHVLAVDQNPPRGRLLEAGDHPQGRRLAAAARAEQGEELPLADVQVEIAHRDQVAEVLAHAVEANRRLMPTGAIRRRWRRRSRCPVPKLGLSFASSPTAALAALSIKRAESSPLWLSMAYAGRRCKGQSLQNDQKPLRRSVQERGEVYVRTTRTGVSDVWTRR